MKNLTVRQQLELENEALSLEIQILEMSIQANRTPSSDELEAFAQSQINSI